MPPASEKNSDPHPISREDFATLLKHSNDFWRAALLLALNCCMYGSEVLAVRWDELDLDAGTLLTNRSKTKVIRAATLWPRTVKALRALPRTALQGIFLSHHGKVYNASAFKDAFAKLRKRAGVSDEVKLNHLRDGAFTSACAAGVSFPLVQILAGQQTAGLSGRYIALYPKMVAPACKAVERAYFGR